MHPQGTLARPSPPRGHGRREAELPAPGTATFLQALRAAGGVRGGAGSGHPRPPALECTFSAHFISLDFFKQICLILLSTEPHGVTGGGNGSRGRCQPSAQALNLLVLPSMLGGHFHLTGGEAKAPRGRPGASEPAGRGTREDSLRAWVPGTRSRVDALGPRGQAAALLPAAGPSSVVAGPQPWVYFCLLLLPSLAFLLGGPPRPIGARGLSLRAEYGYTPPSSRRNPPHPKRLAEHPVCPVSGLHWPRGEGGVLGTAGFVASRLGRGQHGLSMKPVGMCPPRPSTQGVRACLVPGGPESPPGDIVHPPPLPHLTPQTRRRGGESGSTPGQNPPSVMSHPGCCPIKCGPKSQQAGWVPSPSLEICR